LRQALAARNKRRMALVKICGIKDEAAFDAVVEAGADYVGLNFFAASPRYVTPARAAELSTRHAGGPRRVGLFVAPGLAEVAAVLDQVRLDVLQVYGGDLEIAALRARFGLPVWQGLGVETEADFPAADAVADGFVVEARPPAGATRPGGNAVAADWGLLAGFPPARFWLLAGGLTPETVAAGLRRTGAAGADVSSGVETAPGVKSPKLIARFVSAARGVLHVEHPPA